MTILAKESANIDSLLSKSLVINKEDSGQSILSTRNAKIVKEPFDFHWTQMTPLILVLLLKKSLAINLT